MRLLIELDLFDCKTKKFATLCEIKDLAPYVLLRCDIICKISCSSIARGQS